MDGSTTAFQAALPLLFSSLPPLSAEAALNLDDLDSPSSRASSTSCRKCRAEVVGGLNGSYWLEGGAVWARCEGCGWCTRREEGVDAQAKTRFPRVKKRRTMLGGTQGAGAGKGVSAIKAVRKEDELGEAEKRARETRMDVHPSPPLPSLVIHPVAARPRPDVAPSPLSRPSSQSPAPSRPAALPTPIPAESLQPPPVAESQTRKRKRTKQPSGLAEMLEAKRRADKASSASVGLQDFLQGM